MKTIIINILGVKRDCCVEIMGQIIRQNKNIRGLDLVTKECICKWYCSFSWWVGKSLKCALDLFFQFSEFSGLKPNISKTKAIG